MEKEKITIEAALVENERRHARLAADLYDPLTGVGCWGDRVDVDGNLVPRVLLQTCPDYARLEPVEQERRRIREDFEFWCARCVTIKDKMSGWQACACDPAQGSSVGRLDAGADVPGLDANCAS